MKKIVCVLSAVLLMACHGNRQSSSVEQSENTQGMSDVVPADTAVRIEGDGQMPPPPPDGENPPPKPPSGGRHGDNPPPPDDNMRGFDPASEDDMPDNGMSRYMENDDEEGWD